MKVKLARNARRVHRTASDTVTRCGRFIPQRVDDDHRRIGPLFVATRRAENVTQCAGCWS